MTVISKPSDTVYSDALNNAELVRESDNDPHALAHTILYLAERNSKLENIAIAAETYIRFGQDPQLHTNLVKALQQFENYETEVNMMDDPKFGLS